MRIKPAASDAACDEKAHQDFVMRNQEDFVAWGCKVCPKCRHLISAVYRKLAGGIFEWLISVGRKMNKPGYAG